MHDNLLGILIAALLSFILYMKNNKADMLQATVIDQTVITPGVLM